MMVRVTQLCHPPVSQMTPPGVANDTPSLVRGDRVSPPGVANDTPSVVTPDILSPPGVADVTPRQSARKNAARLRMVMGEGYVHHL
jgi:hypothetical protein